MRAVRRAARILLTRAVCAPRASSSVWIAADICPAANARICWMAKTGHTLSVAGHPGVRSWGGTASVGYQPSRWNLHVADHSLFVMLPPPLGPSPQAVEGVSLVPCAGPPDTMAVRGCGGWPGSRVAGT